MLEYTHDKCAALWHLMLEEITPGRDSMSSCGSAEKLNTLVS